MFFYVQHLFFYLPYSGFECQLYGVRPSRSQAVLIVDSKTTARPLRNRQYYVLYILPQQVGALQHPETGALPAIHELLIAGCWRWRHRMCRRI